MNISQKHIVIIGATSTIASKCAELWAKKEAIHFTLIGRNQDKLEALSKSLTSKNPESKITILKTSFLHPDKIQETVNQFYSQGAVDTVLIAHGNLYNQNKCQIDLNQLADSLLVNGISPVLFAEAFAKHMEKENKGTIAIIGSIAGDRGRKINYVYGASKGLITCYTEGLQHRFAGTAVKIVLIKPGPTDTPMGARLKSKSVKLESPDRVAKDIVAAIEKGRPILYTPPKWRFIMIIAKHLPRFIFHKLNL